MTDDDLARALRAAALSRALKDYEDTPKAEIAPVEVDPLGRRETGKRLNSIIEDAIESASSERQAFVATKQQRAELRALFEIKVGPPGCVRAGQRRERTRYGEQRRAQFARPSAMSKSPDCPLVPVHGAGGCVGHLRRTAHGLVAYDRDDKPIGIFTNTNDGAAALLDLATNGDN